MRESEEIRKFPEEDQKKRFIPAEELFAKLGLPERTKDEEQSEQRWLCREVLTNKVRTHQALLKYCFAEKKSNGYVGTKNRKNSHPKRKILRDFTRRKP